MRFAAVSVGLLAAAPALSAQGPTPAAARAEVLATIDSFLVGLRTKDKAKMARYTDTLSRFTQLRPGPNFTRVMLLTTTRFLSDVNRPNPPALGEPIHTHVLEPQNARLYCSASFICRRMCP